MIRAVIQTVTRVVLRRGSVAALAALLALSFAGCAPLVVSPTPSGIEHIVVLPAQNGIQTSIAARAT